MLPSHMFKASDGSLYDTRDSNWSRNPPLRAEYARHSREINSAAAFKANLRAGAFAWPGGYPIAFLTSDGDLLCHHCAQFHARDVMNAIRRNLRDGWRVVACDVIEEHSEESPECCDHCNKPLA